VRYLAMSLLAALCCGPAGIASAQQAASPEAMVTNAGAAALPPARDIGECFDRWLTTQPGLTEGVNRRATGTLFMARGVAELSAQPRSPQWMVNRQAAFTRAELNARAALARYLSEEVESGRSVEVFQGGTDAAAPTARPVTTQVSNAERLSTLAGEQLDSAIRQFNPQWNGANVSEEERRAQAAREQVNVQQNIVARAQMFMAGAMTAQQCEGPDADGRYAVSVTLFWSQRLQEIAENIIDPAHAVRVAPGPSLAEQFRQQALENPTWLTSAMGVRVWTNDTGERVVVGFGAVGGSSSASIDEDRARLQALGAIQRFVGERLEVRDSETGQFAARETGTGERQVFDNQAFQQKIEARARTVRLQGITTLQRWRGRHPWADTPMQVVVLVWTPSNSLAAETAREEAQQAQQRMRAGQEVLPSGRGGPTNPTAAPTRSGPSSNAADF
jgi:hypothetical protein